MLLADQENQAKLKRMYEAQQTEIGQAALKAQKDLAERLKERGINTASQEVVRIVNPKTGERRFYIER